jgi:DNA-binding protein H-NS
MPDEAGSSAQKSTGMKNFPDWEPFATNEKVQSSTTFIERKNMETIANERIFEAHHAEKIGPATNVATLDQIEAEHNAARRRFEETDARLKEAIARNRESVIQRLQADIYRYGITKSEVKLAVPPSVPKYRDPVTGDTWSGKGNAPLWTQGKPLEQFINPEWLAKQAAKTAK